MPTKFRVRIALTAERDIEAIWAFIANDNVEAAGRFIYQFNEATSRAGIEPRRQLKYRKGDARPLWKPHNFVPASRGGVNIESKSGSIPWNAFPNAVH